jgi:hypothetical protein
LQFRSTWRHTEIVVLALIHPDLFGCFWILIRWLGKAQAYRKKSN